MGLAEELARLQQLHQSGALTYDEYARAKSMLLNETTTRGAPSAASPEVTFAAGVPSPRPRQSVRGRAEQDLYEPVVTWEAWQF